MFPCCSLGWCSFRMGLVVLFVVLFVVTHQSWSAVARWTSVHWHHWKLMKYLSAERLKDKRKKAFLFLILYIYIHNTCKIFIFYIWTSMLSRLNVVFCHAYIQKTKKKTFWLIIAILKNFQDQKLRPLGAWIADTCSHHTWVWSVEWEGLALVLLLDSPCLCCC